MTMAFTIKELIKRIEELETKLQETEHLKEAILAGEVDAFAINHNNKSEIYTLESSDYAYRVLVEESVEGALNITEDGLIVYTNPSFYKMIDYSDSEVLGAMLTDFIIPEFKTDFEKALKEARIGNSKIEINLKGKLREVPVYLSMTSLRPKMNTLGVIVTDLTEKKKSDKEILAYQKKLESKNKSLEKMNSELQSFAHISSHDLQEPLRKIQLISKRLLEEEINNISVNGKDLLYRMHKAVSRMQTVIDDLLELTTININKSKPELIDLYAIIEELSEEFSEEILRKNAVINCLSETSIRIVPIQFRQLLHNLISNSLKFNDGSKPLIIDIKCKKVNSSEIDLQGLLPNREYCHLSVQDNGIGFDPEYKDKIFGLFTRLHDRSRYKGTGIGLAIVKKIIDNHKGMITAESALGKGARFDIFLPH